MGGMFKQFCPKFDFSLPRFHDTPCNPLFNAMDIAVQFSFLFWKVKIIYTKKHVV